MTLKVMLTYKIILFVYNTVLLASNDASKVRWVLIKFSQKSDTL